MIKKLLFRLVLLFITLQSFSQANFQSGYYVTSNGSRVEGLIKNEKWNSNPTNFVFKENENSTNSTIEISSVAEFGINGIVKFLKARVEIDMSSDKVNSFSNIKEPHWETKTLFLKVLLEGGTSLLYYEDQGLKKYFYTIDNEVKQLVYKRYNTGVNRIKENNYYKQQLLNAFANCERISRNRFSNLSYTKSALVSVFEDYNNCKGKSTVDFTKKTKKPIINLYLGAGMASTTIAMQHTSIATLNPDFGATISWRMSAEAEVIFPFHDYRWGFF